MYWGRWIVQNYRAVISQILNSEKLLVGSSFVSWIVDDFDFASRGFLGVVDTDKEGCLLETEQRPFTEAVEIQV